MIEITFDFIFEGNLKTHNGQHAYLDKYWNHDYQKNILLRNIKIQSIEGSKFQVMGTLETKIDDEFDTEEWETEELPIDLLKEALSFKNRCCYLVDHHHHSIIWKFAEEI